MDAVASNHEPHDADAKLAPFSLTEAGVSTFDTCLAALHGLVDNGKITLRDAVATVTTKPSEILGIDAGHLGVGARADICVFDPAFDWLVEPDSMLSQGKNSLLSNRMLRGKVRQTFIAGRSVYERSNRGV